MEGPRHLAVRKGSPGTRQTAGIMGESGRKPLTLKQRRFVEEYAASDGNAVQAYYRAFGRYTAKGTRRTYRGAQNASSLLLSNPIIQGEIAAANDEYARRIRVSKRKALRELAAVAFSDPDDVYEPDPDNRGLPTPRPWRDVPAAARKAIRSVKVKRKRLTSDKDDTAWEVEELEYRFHSKTDALDKLCKKLGLFDTDIAAELAELREQLRVLRASRSGATGGTQGPS